MIPCWSDNPHHCRALAEMWGAYMLDLLARDGSGITEAARQAAHAAALALEAQS